MKAAGIAVSSSSPAHCREPGSRMESEVVLYKQKMEQMTTLIRHYQDELESQKMRRDGVETVSRLLTESRQENTAVKKQLAASQMIVKNLQNRMALNGRVPSVEAGDNEVIIPGTSRQTLTNLALENKRLRNLLQQENSADIGSDLQQTAEDTENRNASEPTREQLTADNHSMKQKLSDLEDLFRSSGSDKDRQLLHYQNEIQRLAQQQQQQQSQGGARTGQQQATAAAGAWAPKLKEQLRALMEQCAGFERQLNSVPEPQPQPEPEPRCEGNRKGPAAQLGPVCKQAVERTESVDGVDVPELLEEKLQLQATVDEMREMNQKWAELSNERERHTKMVERQVHDLTEQLRQAAHRANAAPEAHHRHVESQLMEQAQRELQAAHDRRKKAEDEGAQLRQEVVQREAQLRQLQTHVTILTQTVRQHNNCDAQGVVEHLKAQIQVCTEDFEKERQDRQIALQKVNSLQEHINRLQKLNNYLQTLLGQTTRPVQEHGHIDIPRIPHHGGGGLSFGQAALAYDSPAFPSSNNNNDNGGGGGGENWRGSPVLQVESGGGYHILQQPDPGPVSLPAAPSSQLLSARGMLKPSHSLSDPALSSEGGQKDNVLTCPKCNREFSEEHQGELLAHMDVCWE